MAYIEFDHVVKEYPSGSSVIRALDEASFTAEQGELSVILGQSGAGIEHSGRHGYRHNRPRSGRRARYYGPAEKGTGDLPAQRHRLRFPVLQSCAEPYRAGKRGACLTHLPRPFRPCTRSDWGSAWGISRHNCPAANNSVYPSPARLPKSRSCCCAMSRPVRSITRPVRKYCSCCRIFAKHKA